MTDIRPITTRIHNQYYKYTFCRGVRYAFINYKYTLYTQSTYLIVEVPFSGHPWPSINICGRRLKGRNKKITDTSSIVQQSQVLSTPKGRKLLKHRLIKDLGEPSGPIHGHENSKEHPFTDEIMESQLPSKWKSLTTRLYDDSTNPNEYLNIFKT